MKKLLTLSFALFLFQHTVLGQVCASSADFNNAGKLILTFADEDEANFYEDTVGNGETGDCAAGATCDQLTSYTVTGTNNLNAGGTEAISFTASLLKDAPGPTLRSDNNSQGSGPGTFTGTIVFTLVGGGTFSCTYTGGALPVELISFNAKAETNAIALNWQTASELNNDYFVLERSVDGRDFSEVTIVKGEGTSAVINEYRALDNNPYNGVNYYRLRQVDFDGTEDFSDIAQVVFRTDKQVGALTVYPTLVQNTNLLNVDLTENNKALSTFDIFDFNGKLVSSIELQGGDMTAFSVDQLQNGIYLIKERNSENNLATRFVIAR